MPTNRVKVAEVRDALELLGGELEELPGLSECPDPTVPNDVFSAIETLMAENPGAFYHTSQYTNPANTATHPHTTAPRSTTSSAASPQPARPAGRRHAWRRRARRYRPSASSLPKRTSSPASVP